jgi:hypothetical protein
MGTSGAALSGEMKTRLGGKLVRAQVILALSRKDMSQRDFQLRIGEVEAICF